jgi:hypothetical protein
VRTATKMMNAISAAASGDRNHEMTICKSRQQHQAEQVQGVNSVVCVASLCVWRGCALRWKLTCVLYNLG